MELMKIRVVVIAFGTALAASCLAQQTSWKTEHDDWLLVAPSATAEQYVVWGRGVESLTYSVHEPYPAADLREYLCDDLKQKGWHARVGCSDADKWWEVHFPLNGTTATNYRWQAMLVSEDNDVVEYTFDYGAVNGEDYLQMLEVKAIYNVGHGRPQPQYSATSEPKLIPRTGKLPVVTEASPSRIDFGAVKLVSISPPHLLTYTFASRTVVQDIRVNTSGQERLDFGDAGTGSCRGGTVYEAGDTCTLNVTFAPRLAATRRGFVLLQEGSGATVLTELSGSGIGDFGKTTTGLPPHQFPRLVDAGNLLKAVIPDHPVGLGQPVRILLKFTDPNVTEIDEIQGGEDGPRTNISSGVAVGSGVARIVSDTGLTKTMEMIPLAAGQTKFGIMVTFVDGRLIEKNYMLNVIPSSKGLTHFSLNHGFSALPIVLEDKPQDRQKWLEPEVQYGQLEYPIYLEDASQIKLTVQQPPDEPVILLDPNGLVHGLRPGTATIIGDFDGIRDQVEVHVYSKTNPPSGYRVTQP
jgi:hypothetical protein